MKRKNAKAMGKNVSINQWNLKNALNEGANVKALPLFTILLLGITIASAATSNSSLLNSTQIQSYAQKIPPPPPGLFQKILYYIAEGYNWLVGLIQNILQNTLLKEDPGLANAYANIIAWLIPLTAIYLLLTFAEVARRFLGYIIAAGWIFLLAVMFLAR